MILTELTENSYRVDLSNEEFQHFLIMTVACSDFGVSSVSDLLEYILTFAEQRWHEALKEPEIDGNSNTSTPSAS